MMFCLGKHLEKPQFSSFLEVTIAVVSMTLDF